MKSLKKLYNKSDKLRHDAETLLEILVLKLKLFNIFDLTRLQYKFKNRKYTESYFDTYNLQYIENTLF